MNKWKGEGILIIALFLFEGANPSPNGRKSVCFQLFLRSFPPEDFVMVAGVEDVNSVFVRLKRNVL